MPETYDPPKYLKDTLEDTSKLTQDLFEANVDLKEIGDIKSKYGKISKFLFNDNKHEFTSFDRKIALKYDEIAEYSQRIEDDRSYISDLIIKKNQDKDQVTGLNDYVEQLHTDLDNIISSLRSSADPMILIETLTDSFSEAYESIDPEAMLLSVLVETFTKALNPFLQIPNLPKIPIIGDLNNILQTLSKLGRTKRTISNLMPADVKKQYEEEQRKNKEGKDWITRMEESEFWSKIKEIGQAIYEVFCMLPDIVHFFWLAVLNELIQILKPVMEEFGLVAGTMMALLVKVPELLSSIWNLKLTFAYRLMKYIWKQIEGMANIFYAIGPVKVDIDSQISVLKQDIISCEMSIDSSHLDINLLASTYALSTAAEIREKIDAKQKKWEKNDIKDVPQQVQIAYKKMFETTLSAAKEDEKYAKSRYDDANQKLKDHTDHYDENFKARLDRINAELQMISADMVNNMKGNSGIHSNIENMVTDMGVKILTTSISEKIQV